MVVFQRCGTEDDENVEYDCATDSEIEQALDGSYILLIENYETYDFTVNPALEEVILKRTHIYWYTMSSTVAQDF